MEAFSSMSKPELLRGMNLCLNNARSLLREADLLARAGARKRAVALAVLAIEETGKVVLLTLASHPERSTASKALTKTFYSHDAKTALLAEQSWKGVLYVRRRKHATVPRSAIQQWIGAYKSVDEFLTATKTQDEAKLKLRALYVDIDKAGRFRPPIEIPSGVFSGLLRIARAGIRDAARLRDTFRRTRTDNLADDIINQMTKSSVLREASAYFREGR